MNTERVVDHIIASAKDQKRYIVAVAGPPGAGKSTLAEGLSLALKERSINSRVIPMDGFHLDNSILAERGLLKRKGAPKTFDAEGFVHLIKRLAACEEEVVIPTFDRERDIAIAGAEVVSKSDHILIVEGNYLLLKDGPWSKLQGLWNTTVFINPGFDELKRRLVDRWVGYGLNEADATERAMSNDIPNAKYVLEHSASAHIELSA